MDGSVNALVTLKLGYLAKRRCRTVARMIGDAVQKQRLETQLAQADRLSSMGMLAAGVAHEVNTPITGISSYAQMLLDDTPTDDPRRELLEKVWGYPAVLQTRTVDVHVRRLRKAHFRPGDLLMMQGSPEAIAEFASDNSCVPLAERELRPMVRCAAWDEQRREWRAAVADRRTSG